MKGGIIILAVVVLLLPPAPCPGDAVFRCKRESTLFGFPNEDKTRNQWISIYNTDPEQLNPNISVCCTFYGGVFPEPGRVANNAGLHKDCFYKVG